MSATAKNQTIGVILFIFVFGLFVGLVSVLIHKFLDPYLEPISLLAANYPYEALLTYFLFVTAASVIVPIPTLPFDLIFLNILSPSLVVIARIAGGLAGGSISYFLAYNHGRPLLKRWLSRKNYDFIERHSDSITWQQFFFINMIPVINTELMAYVGGLGKLGYRKTIATLMLAVGYRVMFVYLVFHL